MASQTAVVVLSRAGLALARRLRAVRPEATVILGPSCIVGACGGPTRAAAADSDGTPLPPRAFATDEPGLLGWTGPLRKLFPTLWGQYDAIVAVMTLSMVIRLAGPLAGERRRGPAVVAVDEAGRFAISVLGGDALAQQVAGRLGATAVVTTTARHSTTAHQPVYEGGDGGPNAGA
jgi:cobalt-precorrin 5A hydrolase